MSEPVPDGTGDQQYPPCGHCSSPDTTGHCANPRCTWVHCNHCHRLSDSRRLRGRQKGQESA